MTEATGTTGFKPNFFSNYSVLLNHPIAEVFSILGTSKGHERTTRLSGLCSDFELQDVDNVTVPVSVPLCKTHVRHLPSSPPTGHHETENPVRNLTRQFFQLKETVPILFGLINVDVNISGTLTWDDETRAALYESETSSGILVWKCRIFEEVEGDKTIVKETIHGRCPRWLERIVQSQTSTAHKAHMELYHTLF